MAGITTLTPSHSYQGNIHVVNCNTLGQDYGHSSWSTYFGWDNRLEDNIAPDYIFGYRLVDHIKPTVHYVTDYGLNEIAGQYACSLGHPLCTVRDQRHPLTYHLHHTILDDVYKKHTIADHSRRLYSATRNSAQFRKSGDGKSAFINVDVVFPLLVVTMRNPDKVTKISNDRISIERRFDTETGHSARGLCLVVRVIAQEERTGPRNVYTVRTAYPTQDYHIG